MKATTRNQRLLLFAWLVGVVLCAPAASAQTPLYRLPADLVAAPGTTTDATTGLPKRVLHRPSGIALVLIPAGEFLMGSPASDEQQRRGLEQQHRRVIRHPFYLGETEVTVAQFRRFSAAAKYQTEAERGVPLDVHRHGSFASQPAGDREWSTIANWRNPFPLLRDYRLQEQHPVVHVSWNDAQSFCAHFNLQLPTEAQWEYAARARGRSHPLLLGRQ
jgi:formylglycine-generating enzyme